MRIFVPILAAVAIVAVAGCSTAPQPRTTSVTVSAPVGRPAPYRWTQGAAPKAHSDMVATFGKAGLKPGQFVWAENVPAAGDTRVIVDLLTQMAYVYRGDQMIGATTISSGKRGKETPLGFWSVLEKKKFHRSRKYDDAPMPFMQRLDEFGIALHGGALPGYPASHGCVRLPMKFAERLYTLTKVGSKVVIEG